MLSVNRYLQWSVWTLNEGEITDDDDETKVVFEKGVTAGRRPVVIISNNTFNNNPRNYVVNILKMSRTVNDNPVHIECMISNHIKSYIQCEQAFTVNKRRLEGFRGVLNDKIIKEIKKALMFQYSMVNDLDLTEPAFESIKNLIDDYVLKRGIEFETRLKEIFIPKLIEETKSNIDGMFDDAVSLIVNDTVKQTEVKTSEHTEKNTVEKNKEKDIEGAKATSPAPPTYQIKKSKNNLTDYEKHWCIKNYKLKPQEVMDKYKWTKSTLVSNVSKYRKQLKA